jgi:transcriptional regulator with XRE-family HTH domain
MTGTDLKTLRARYGISLRTLARLLKLKQYMQIWHWERGTYPIPVKHQVRLAHLFMECARRQPPLQACPLCQGAGLIKERMADAHVDRAL